MNRDLRICLGLIIVPALVLLLAGAGYFYKQAQDAEVRAEENYWASAGTLAMSIGASVSQAMDEVEDEGGDVTNAVRRALCAWTNEAAGAKPVGAFTWIPRYRKRSTKKPVVAATVVSNRVWVAALPAAGGTNVCLDAVAARLGAMVYRNELLPPDAHGKRKDPDYGLFECEGRFLLWKRLEHMLYPDALYGLVFDASPVVRSESIWDSWVSWTVFLVAMSCILGASFVYLAVAVRRARADDALKTEFLSNCTHELKTPLTGIGIWVDMLQSGVARTEERRAQAYGIIAHENGRMIRLVENLLDLSRLEQKRRTYKMEDLDLMELAESCVTLVRGNFTGHGISVVCAEERGRVRARGDADAVRQILFNVLSNAAKYAAADGPVEVEVAADGVCAHVSVRDNGPGLSAEARAHVFDRFYRADNALDATTRGLGIGLSISKALAQDMHGTLAVSPNPSGGCVFTLSLPEKKL